MLVLPRSSMIMYLRIIVKLQGVLDADRYLFGMMDEDVSRFCDFLIDILWIKNVRGLL